MQNENMFENIGTLTVDLLRKTKAQHCYTIITDSMYANILNGNLFDRLIDSTYIVIRIPDHEDMLNPSNEQILESLMEARQAGCETYLIYLANGIQMERFLRFIDEYIGKL